MLGHLEEVNLQSADQCNGGVWEEPEEEGEVHLEIFVFQNLDFRRKKPNHGDDLEEGGDEEEVGEEEGEHQGGDTPTLLPLAEGDLRYKTRYC